MFASNQFHHNPRYHYQHHEAPNIAAGVPPMQDRFQAEQGRVNHMEDLDDFELEWAWEIKDAIRDHEDLKDITDYEVAQLAIVTLGQEDISSVLERVFTLQCLKDEYNLNETPEEAVELMRGLTCVQQPGHILAFDLAPNGKSYIGVFDFAKNKPSAVDLPKDWRIYMGAYFYLLSAACANLACVREGFVSIVECDGMSYKTFSHKMQQRWSQELGMHYPIQTKESLWVNTPLVANVMCAFVKPWMNSRKQRWEKIRLGCKMDWFEGRMDQLMNVPTPKAAQEKLLHNLHQALTERYHRYRTYSLPDRPMEEEEEETVVFRGVAAPPVDLGESQNSEISFMMEHD